MRLIDLVKQLPGYRESLDSVPEDQRAAALAALEQELQPYEMLLAALPGDALGKLTSSLSNATSTTTPPTGGQASRREPRRF